MREWRSVTVGEFCPFLYGKSLPENIRKEGNIPVVSSSGVTGRHDTALVQTKGIVIGRKGTVGKITRIQEPFWPIDTAFYIADEPKKKDLNFTYYLLQTLGLEHMNSDSAVPGLNRNNAHARTIHVPPLPEQKAIAEILGALDDKIALNRRMCKTLESMAQALFKSWFVDFDPVHAKMRGEQPYGMDAPMASMFPDKLVESELGLIPEGWNSATLGTAYEINPTRKLKKGEWAPYLDMANMPTKEHYPDIVIKREVRSGSKFINGDTTLLARITPCLENGKTAFVDFLDKHQVGCGSTEFIVLRPKALLPPYHAYLLCRHNSFRDFAIQSMSGTSGRQRAQNNVLSSYLIAIPTQAIAEAFESIITPLQQKITDNSNQAKILANLRDYLLPKLVSGEVSVK